MNEFADAAVLASKLVLHADATLLEIVRRSLEVSLAAVGCASVLGLSAGALLAVTRFPGRKLCIILTNALMGLPPVVVGLLVYLSLSRTGPFGGWGLLFTPTAMVIAQIVLITPIICALSRQTLEDLWLEYAEQLRSLRVTAFGSLRTLLWEARYSLLTAILAGFGRAIAEVGAVLIVGGNIAHVTRVMTTTIALETSRGDLALALALGFILITIAMLVNGTTFVLRELADCDAR
ncbi:MAG: ABC transporter permease subunit [Gammaproteobacteria bacterium]|nr:ABC transporter permease subunit [Gammaproteobacteria bacterium]